MFIPTLIYRAFDIFSESHFLLGALHRSKFANFCHDLMPFVVTIYVQKVLFLSLVFKHQIFPLFPTVKINANYAEICRVGNLEADFQQVPLVQFFFFFFFFFSEMFTILL